MKRAAFILASLVTTTAPGEEATYDLPYIEDITIDGDSSDWGHKGFRVEIFEPSSIVPFNGLMPARTDTDVSVSLAWDSDGLLFFADVKDDVAIERNNMFNTDAVQLAFEPEHARGLYLDLLMTADRTGAVGSLRTKGLLAEATVQQSVDDANYVLEGRIPWDSLHQQGRVGAILFGQISFMDTDLGGRGDAMSWNQLKRMQEIEAPTKRLRLARSSSRPVLAFAQKRVLDLDALRFDIHGDPQLIGEKFALVLQDQELANGVFREKDGWAYAEVPYSPTYAVSESDIVSITSRDVVVGRFSMPDLRSHQADVLSENEFVFRSEVFSGHAFPEGDFADPVGARKAIGNYKLSYRYFDADYNEVHQPKKPGRYGAVVSIEREAGIPLQRFQTLYKSTDDSSTDSAIILAANAELPHDKTLHPTLAKPSAIDALWWIGFRQAISAKDGLPRRELKIPRKQSMEALTLRQGTEAEAGMRPGTVDAMDAYLRRWEEESGIGCVVCVARNGIIFMHRAYGYTAGKPVTLNSIGSMETLTRMLSGVGFMALADEGRINLDQPLVDYLPSLEQKNGATHLTARHLFTNTSGFRGRTNGSPDFFERMIPVIARLEPGQVWFPSDKGHHLAGAAVEQLTGKSVAQFFHEHIFQPLGSENAVIHDMSRGGYMTALDLAKLSQVILNKGSYGDLRFFGEESYEELLPQDMHTQFGIPNRRRHYGMGPHRFGAPFSSETLGYENHGQVTLRIDLTNDLIVVRVPMATQNPFNRIQRQWLQIIADGMIASGASTSP